MSLIISLLKIINSWLMEKPKNEKVCEIFSKTFLVISGLLLTLLISEPMYEYISAVTSLSKEAVAVIIAIILTTLFAVCHITVKLIEVVADKDIGLPHRYKLLFSIMTIPTILLGHKFIVAPLIKKYGQKNLSGN